MTHPPGRRPVIAVIPSYNMGESLRTLLPQVLGQGYDAVYVLDDCSRDKTHDIVRQFPGVHIMIGDKNLGASGNRNRTLTAAKHWADDTIIHFIDADVRLETPHIPHILRHIFKYSTIGIVGGLVIEPNGRQSPYNFGPRASFESIFSSILQLSLQHATPSRVRGMRQRFPALRHWPDISGPPQGRDTHFVLEGNMAMSLRTLKAIGGFDSSLRHNEAQDLANKIAGIGLRNRFDPSFAVQHLKIDVRGPRRHIDFILSGIKMLHRNKWPLR